MLQHCRQVSGTVCSKHLPTQGHPVQGSLSKLSGPHSGKRESRSGINLCLPTKTFIDGGGNHRMMPGQNCHPSVCRLVVEVVACQISPADRPLSHCWAIVTAAGARRAAWCGAGSPSGDRTRNRSKPTANRQAVRTACNG